MEKVVVIAAVALSFGALAVGCGAPTDNTANRMADDAPHDADYPAGPYGYTQNTVAGDYKFLGKTPTPTMPYSALPMRDLYLGEFHSDATVKYLLVEGSANWCPYCNQEAPDIEALAVKYQAQGFRALTVLAEGHTPGVPAVASDLTDWAEMHNFKVSDMAIDPAETLFQYASASAFPLHILLETSTMEIKWLCVGGIGACDSTTAVAQAFGSSTSTQ